VLNPKTIQVRRRRKFIAEKDIREATQVAQMPRTQVQRAQAQKVVQNGYQVQIKIQNSRRNL